MALSDADRAELNRLGIENVKLKLTYAGPGGGAVVPGLRPGYGVERGVVEEAREALRRQSDSLWWAKAATWIGAAGILVAIAIAALGKWLKAAAIANNQGRKPCPGCLDGTPYDCGKAFVKIQT